jgi:hypothetical protein
MPLDNLITRYPNGVTNFFDNQGFANLKVPDPSIYHWLLEDFDQFTLAQWVTGGVGTPVAPALAAGDGGILSMANSAANGDNNWLQAAMPAWSITPGKKLFFRARASINAVAFGSIALGLQVTVAANNFLTPTNGLFLRKSASNTGMELVSRSAGVETASTTVGDYTGGTVDVFFAYDGQGNIIAGANNTPAVSITPAALPVGILTLTLGVQNTSAAVRTMLVDQIFVAKER